MSPNPDPAPLARHLTGADHLDVKTVVGRAGLREFLSAMLGADPAWLRGLYVLRGGLAAILGLTQPPRCAVPGPEALDLSPGAPLRFFTTLDSDGATYWAGEAVDRHLSAVLAVEREPLGAEPDGPARFRVTTAVRYRHWTGPVYFNLIRPFHHLVVARMARAGARGGRNARPEARPEA
ncbi:MAG: DUF2867 domain-containing protein [Desulfovibrionaceae bacterium]